MTTKPFRPISADQIVPGSVNSPMTLTEKTKLAGIAEGATASVPGDVIKLGQAKTASGTKSYGVPGTSFTAIATIALTANRKYYFPFVCAYDVTITDWILNVTTGPASNANVRHGIYSADGDLQPTGTVLYDSGGTAISSGATGTQSASSLSIALATGRYAQCIEVDVDMTLRTAVAPTPAVGTTFGSSGLYSAFYVSETYGTLPSTATKWSTLNSDTTGLKFPVVYKWTE